MKYYSAYDLQNGDYFYTGINSQSERECLEDIYKYLIEGIDDQEILHADYDPKKMTDEQLRDEVSSYDVRIDEHNGKLGEQL